MYAFYLLLISLLLFGVIIIGEFFTTKFPKTKFGKFWRKYVVMDGDNETWD